MVSGGQRYAAARDRKHWHQKLDTKDKISATLLRISSDIAVARSCDHHVHVIIQIITRDLVPLETTRGGATKKWSLAAQDMQPPETTQDLISVMV